MYDAEISIPGNQMFVVFQTNEEIVHKGFHALIIESKYFYQQSYPNLEITYQLRLHKFQFQDDHCQYWFNKADGVLRSPNFGANDKLDYYYDCNLNCTWILDTDQEYYITLELDYFMVIYSKDTLHFHNFSNKVYHSSFTWVTISQYMMDQISNHPK